MLFGQSNPAVMAIFLAISVSSCHQNTNTVPGPDYEMVVISGVTYNEALHKAYSCNAYIEYPKFGGSSPMKDWVEKFVSRPVFGPTQPPSPESVKEQIFEVYQMRCGIENPIEEDWYLRRAVSIFSHAHNILTIRARENYFVGGAKPSKTEHYACFDLSKNKKLDWPDLTKDTAQFKAKAEAALKAKLSINGDYLTNGLSFRGGHFFVPDNFYPKGDSLVFVYNPHEIMGVKEGIIYIPVKKDE